MEAALEHTVSIGPPSWIGHVITVVLALVATLGLLLALSRWAMRKKHLWQTQQALRSVATLVLAPQKTVHIVEIAQTLYVLGVAEHISVIDKIEDAQSIALLRAPTEKKTIHNVRLKRSAPMRSPERIRAIVEQTLRKAVSRS